MIVGKRLCGRIDRVPGLLHVATEFYHVNWLPLVPLKSWIVFDGSERSEWGGHGAWNQWSVKWRGVPVAFSLRSVLAAWFRASLVVAGIFLAMFGVIEMLGRLRPLLAFPLLVAGVVCFVLSWLSTYLSRASMERAVEMGCHANVPLTTLARFLGVPPAEIGAIEDPAWGGPRDAGEIGEKLGRMRAGAGTPATFQDQVGRQFHV
ncbi:MAG: hypothetical protein HY720_06445 [Planctomycetes bacterium]|nr:hypothetical protein [Planctomycetota bacterium]